MAQQSEKESGCATGLVPGNFPKFFIPVGSREFFRFPGKFRENFMYCE